MGCCGSSISDVPLPGDGPTKFQVKHAGVLHGGGYTVFTGDGQQKWMHVHTHGSWHDEKAHFELESMTKEKQTLTKCSIKSDFLVNEWEEKDSKNPDYQEDLAWKDGTTKALIRIPDKVLEAVVTAADVAGKFGVEGAEEVGELASSLQEAKQFERDHRWGEEISCWKWRYTRDAKFEDSEGKAAATLRVSVTGFTVLSWGPKEEDPAMEGKKVQRKLAHPVLCTAAYELLLDSQGGKPVVVDAGADCYNLMAKASLTGKPEKLGPNYDRTFRSEIFDATVKIAAGVNNRNTTVDSKGNFSAAMALTIAFALAYPMHAAEMMENMNARALAADKNPNQKETDEGGGEGGGEGED